LRCAAGRATVPLPPNPSQGREVQLGELEDIKDLVALPSVARYLIPPDFTVDFASRSLPGARVYYTSGDRDEQLLSITDSGIVRFGQGNKGD
jgi:hypothetical protein